ncbi:MAG: SDR family oxidoreductase [Rudaea sp.]
MSEPNPQGIADTASFRALITGGSGYLGSALLALLARRHPGWEIHTTFHSHPPQAPAPRAHSLDLRDLSSAEQAILAVRPRLIVHTAAQMTGSPDDLRRVNVSGSEAVARAAAALDARLIHLSTDLVFDGEKGDYGEEDTPHPILPYGESKREGEQAVLECASNTVVVRTSLIYGFDPIDPRTAAVLGGTMPRLFTDEIRCPVWIRDLCAALDELAALDYRGILHVAGPQPLSRYEFGLRLYRSLRSAAPPPLAARSAGSGMVRPLNCTLDTSRARRLLKTPLLDVDAALKSALID